MNIFDFLSQYMIGNESLYIFITLIILIIYYLLFKKYIKIFLDPLVILLFHLVIYSSTVVFMYVLNLIDDRFFIHYVVTTVFLIIGLRFFHPIDYEKVFNGSLITNEAKTLELAYRISALFYILCQMYIILRVGFPIFQSDISRLILYQPVAVYVRLANSVFVICICCITHKFFDRKLKVFDKILIVFIFINFALSGGKGSFASVIFYIIVLSSFSRDAFQKFIRYQWKILLFILGIFMGIIFLLMGEDEFFLEKLIFVLIGRADSYIAFYTSDYGEIMSFFAKYDGVVNFLGQSFFNWLAVFKLIPYEELPISYANLMNLHTFGSVTDEMGMVATYNLFPLAYLGWGGSILFSFFVGVSYSFVRNKLIYYCNGSWTLRIFYAFTFMSFNTFVISMPVFWSGYLLGIGVCAIIISLSYVLNRILMVK